MTSPWPAGAPVSYGPLIPRYTEVGDRLNYQPQTVGGAFSANETALKGSDRIRNFAYFFGVPRKAVDVDPHEQYDIEHQHLPDAFIGKNLLMEKILIDSVKDSDMYMVTELFPLEKKEDGMQIYWTMTKFDTHRLNRQPEESVPRLQVYSEESGQASMVRFGTGVMLEHGFMGTRKGVETYIMHMQQISNAIAITMAHGAAVTALEYPPYRDRNEIYRPSGASSYDQLLDRCRNEKENFAIANKDRFGLQTAERELRKTMQNRIQRAGDYIVYPQGLMDLAAYDDYNSIYALSGNRSLPSAESTIRKAFPSVTRKESIGYAQSDHQPPDDPFFRRQTIGNYFTMVNNHLKTVPVDEYKTGMMDTYIFSRSRDAWTRICLADAVPNGGLWDWKAPGKPWTSLGEDYFQGDRGRNEFGDKVFHTYGDFCMGTGTSQKIIECILSWKRDGEVGKAKLREFIRKFDPTLESFGSSGTFQVNRQPFDDQKYSPDAAAGNDDDDDMDIEGNTLAAGAGVRRRADAPSSYLSASRNTSSSRPPRNTRRSNRAGSKPKANADASYDNGVPPQDMDKIIKFITEKESAAGDVNAKMGYQHLREFLKKLSVRESDPLAQHFLARKHSVMDSRSSIRGTESKTRLARYAYEIVQRNPENSSIFTEVFYKLQPALYELDMDMSLEYVKQNAADFGGLTAYERLALSKDSSDDSTRASFRDANKQSPALSFDFHSSTPARQGGVRLPLSVQSNAGYFSIPRERDSESITLTSHFLPLFYIPSHSLHAVLESKEYNAGAVRIHHGEDEASETRVALAQFATSSSLVYAYALEEAEKHSQRVREHKAQSSSSNGKKSKGGAAAAAAAQAEEKNWDTSYMDLEPDYEEICKNILKLICLNPTDGMDHRLYKQALDRANVLDFNPLATQYQLRCVSKKIRELVWFVINDKRPAPSLSVHVKALFHCIKYTASLSADHQPLPADDSKVGGVGMDLAFRMQEFKGDFTQSQIDGMERESEEKLGTFYSQLVKDAGEDRKRFHEKLFASSRAKGWLHFFQSLYIIVTKEKSTGDTEQKKQENFELLVFAFAEILKNSNLSASSKDEAIHFFISAASAYPLGPIRSKVTGASGSTKEAKAKSIADEVVSAAEEFTRLQGEAKARTVDNRYYSSGREVAELGAAGVALDSALTLWDALQACSYAFKAFLSGMLKGKDLTKEVEKMFEKDDPQFTGLVWGKFSGHLPNVGISWAGNDQDHRHIVAKALYIGALGISAATNVFGEKHVQEVKSTLSAVSLDFDGETDASRSEDSKYDNAASRIDKSIVSSIMNKTRISSGDMICFFLENDVPSPFGAIGWRPHGTFLMSTLLYAVKGAAGRTWYGYQDFQLGDDVMRKIHFGNYTQYHTTAIMDPRFLCLYRNIAVHNYFGGDGHEFWNPCDPLHAQQYSRSQIFRDIFITLVPANHNPTNTCVMDIAGCFSKNLGVDDDCNRRTEYFGSRAYTRQWRWKHDRQSYNINDGLSASKQPKGNTMCFQTAQKLYVHNPGSKQATSPSGMANFLEHVPDMGHWGDENIYPGCMRVLYGKKQVFDSANPALNVRAAQSSFHY